MNSPTFSLQWLPFLFLIFSTSVSTATLHNIPRLSPIGRTLSKARETVVSASVNFSDDLQTFYYNQTLDHFNYRPERYSTFQQRYVINSKYWGGANSRAPIFAYFGGESPLDEDVVIIGFLTDNAVQFKALILYMEVFMNTQRHTHSQHSFSLSLSHLWVLQISHLWYI
jgi:lysosomal Pro-X carboxypeptidase